MVRYHRMMRKNGGRRSCLEAVTTVLLIFVIVYTIFAIYRESQDVHAMKLQSFPLIVAWTRFFGGSLRTSLLPSLNDCVYKCHVIERKDQKLYLREPSAFLLHERDVDVSDLPPASSRHLIVFMLMESPHHTGSAIYQVPRSYFNATMTYRRDSRYFFPYGQFVPLTPEDKENKSVVITQQKILNSLKKKTRGSLIFVSNCDTHSRRENVIKELGQYTEVTVRGDCEDLLSVGDETRSYSCRSDCDDNALIATHRFYFSFENSLCNEYITEKFYTRVSQLLVPVVMKRRIYEGTDVPSDSFIALDDFNSTEDLGNYLNYLRKNDTAYLKYFEWTKHYRMPYTYRSDALCRLCSDIYHEKHLEIEDIVEYYVHNQCSDAGLLHTGISVFSPIEALSRLLRTLRLALSKALNLYFPLQ